MKRKTLYILIGVLVLGGIGIAFATRNTSQTVPTVTVVRGTVKEEVNVTGKVKPVEEVTLAFERSGIIRDVRKTVGDRVTQGETVLSLDASELAAQLAQAEAGLAAQKARLEELKRGPRPETIQVKQTELAKAEQDLKNDYASVPDVVRDALNDTEGAVRNDIDSFFTDDTLVSAALAFQISDSQLEVNVENGRVNVESLLSIWTNDVGAIGAASSQATLDTALSSASQRLSTVRSFLENVLQTTSVTIGVSSSSLTSYRTSALAARATVNASITAVNNQIQDIAAQKVTVRRLNDELAVTLSGTDPEQIAAQEAQVKNAEANVQLIEAQLGKMSLRSPMTGTVTRQDGKRGAFIAANSPIVSVISEGNLEIEANVPEVDVGKIAIGNPVRITVDAFPGDVFMGTLSHIDPGETIVDGVVNFKVRIAFTEDSGRIKSGLTTNLAIETFRKDNVLVLPQYAIIDTTEGKFVEKQNGASFARAQITTGLRASDGRVEILSGLTEGDVVKNVSATTTN